MKIRFVTIHAHPVAVHFTNALYPVALLFLVLYLWTENDTFSVSYFSVLIVATISVPVSYVSGIIDWWQEYDAAPVEIFMKKLRYGAVLFFVGLTAALWYAADPAVLAPSTKLRKVLFVLLNFSILPLVMYLGYKGGRLVFRKPH